METPKKKPKPSEAQSESSIKSSDDNISTSIGMSELAISPPHVAWDPDYLLEIDPRYVEENGGEIMDESEVVWNSEDDDEETYYQSDEYTEPGARAEDTEVFTESEGEFLDKSHDDIGETDFDDEPPEEHYKTPTGIPRPVLRFE